MADDIAVLGMEIDSRDVKIAARDLMKLLDAARQTERQTEKTESAFDKLNNRVRGLLAPFNDLRTLLLGLGIGALTREIIQLADSYQLINARLKLVTSSTEELKRVQTALFQVAQNTGTSYAATAELYTRMARGADSLGASTAQMVRITDLFSKAMTVSGAAASETESVIRQFSQSITKGRVTGDEFNSMLENGQGLLEFAARGLGMTLQQLVLMGKDGQLATKLLAEGLLKAGNAVDESFGELPMTVGRAMQGVQNEFGKFIDTANQSSKFTNQLSDSLVQLTNVFNDPAFKEAGEKALAGMATSLTTIVGWAPAAVMAFNKIVEIANNIYSGWQQLPEWMQKVGIVGAIFGGKVGIAIALGIGAIANNIDQGVKKILTDMVALTGIQIDLDKAGQGANKTLIDQADALGPLSNTMKGAAGVSTDLAKAWKVDQDELDKLITKHEQHQKTVDNEMQTLRDNVAVLKAEVTVGKEAAERLATELQLRRQLGDGYSANAREIAALIDEQAALNRQLSVQEELRAEAKQSADAYIEIWKNAAQQIQGAFAQMFASIFDGGTAFLSSLANVAKQLFSQLATQAVFGNLLTGLQNFGVAGKAGGVGISLAGGVAGGAAAAGFSIPGLTTLTQATPFLGAGFGALGGGLIGKALGLSKTGSSIGGAAGGFGALPYLLAGGNPLIAAGFLAASTLIGGLVGNLFKGKPSDKLEGSIYNFATGGLRDIGNVGAKDSPENTQIVSGIIDTVRNVQRLVTSIGGTVNLAELDVRAGDRSGISYQLAGLDGSRVRGTASDAPGAAAAILDSLVGYVQGVGPIVQKALETVDLIGNENAQSLIQFAAELESFLSDNEPANKVSALQAQFNALDDQLEDFRRNLVAIGQSADLADPTIARLKQSLVDDFLSGLDREVNALRGNGFLNDIQASISAFDELRANAETAGAGLDRVDEIFTRSITKIVESIVSGAGSLDAAAPSLDLIRSTFANFPEIIAALEGVISAAGDSDAIREMEAAEIRVRDLRLSLLRDELGLLQDQQRELQGQIRSYQTFVGAVDNALFRLNTDPNLGASGTGGLAYARSTFDQLQAAAAGGDLTAQAQLPEVGLSLVQLSRQMFGSGAEFFGDRDRVQSVLSEQKSVAVQQLEISQGILNANLQQVALLQGTITNVQRGGVGAVQGFSPADLDALTRQFTSDLAAGGNVNDLISTYEPSLFNIIGGVSDVDRLLSDLSQAEAQKGDPVYGGTASRRAEAIRNRLAQLGVSLPGRAIGGGAYGAFRAHPNEIIVTGSNAQVLTASQAGDAVARGSASFDRMEQAYRIGTQATVAALRDLAQGQAETNAKLDRLDKQLGRIKEKVGV